ncbi:TPA: ABC transporter permease [Pasteurella multocida]|uniref:ABC transporter permease n=1 Tax=Pasteurella multocida TaxID=747 RepID=UPI0028DE191D|nr:FtsX-like permease family protein [Pasteurella multocida]MDY0499698.1 FtsX-like permease family protein [Pasteurella multocida]MDY0656135.1 FtsX-like permease family protein [Pasteurella multocida]WRU40929.1 FtsX-like permease family protein [Pasteurella multocida]HDR1921017.1 ABC transporter permease [Pasteurella multocida]HEA3245500.1 ABC transporter permease [Pasteurella multocida]
MVANKPKSMFWRLVFRALRLRLQRVLIIFAALTVGASIVTAMAAVYFDINTKMSQELRTFGANFYIGSNSRGLIQEQQLQQILAQAPAGLVTAASPYLYGVTRSELEKIVIMGVWFEDMKTLSPYWQVTGSQIGVNFDDRNAMIGKTLAERLQLNVGDSITLSKNTVEKHRFHIKAIIEAGDATDNMLIVNLEFAQHWLEKEGQATNALLNVKNDQGQVEQFATSLQQTYPDLEIRPIRKVSASEGQILEKIKGLMGLISVVILILATLCVNTTLIAIVGERAKEFALQKALGAKKQDIIQQIGTEAFIIAICAIFTGLVIGYLLAQVLGLTVFKAYIDIRLPVIPITILLSLLVAFIAVIIPTRRALAIQTANVLKGE